MPGVITVKGEEKQQPALEFHTEAGEGQQQQKPKL